MIKSVGRPPARNKDVTKHPFLELLGIASDRMSETCREKVVRTCITAPSFGTAEKLIKDDGMVFSSSMWQRAAYSMADELLQYRHDRTREAARTWYLNQP